MNPRRVFIKKVSLGAGNLMLASSVFSFISCDDKGKAYEENNKKTENMIPEEKKLGIALVGLGDYSENQLAPALKETKYCQLKGIVTGTPSKVDKWKKDYNIPDSNVYSYENFESIKDNKDIDIVYIVLPNALHAEYTIKAAKAGKHVICEKPMAVSVKECEEMIKACKEANRMLAIGYRVHYDPFHKEMMRLGNDKIHGAITSIKAENGFKLSDNAWRAKKELAGGGPLMDLGIYCVQGAIYTMGQNPIAVTAKEGPKTEKEKFKTVEQSISWTLEFPGGVKAECVTSYHDKYDLLRADAEKGWFELAPAYDYSGKKGKTHEGKMDFPDVYEQVFQMDDFAQNVMKNTPSKVPGEMGLRDVKILMAIYEAAKSGKRITLDL